MTHANALELATKIGRLLIEGSQRLRRQSINKHSLMGTLSVMAAAKAKDIKALNPAIQEIILFGSSVTLADSICDVGDVDLMIFDNGFYSNILCIEPDERQRKGFDRYRKLRRNLSSVVEDWFEFTTENSMSYSAVKEEPVDLHVLPLALFTDPDRRQKIAAEHTDPRFFNNAFSAIMRFDFQSDQFVPTTLAYFEQKYGCKLAGLSA